MAFEQYEIFSEQTRSAEHGNIAKFWMMYLDCIQANQVFDRAVRSNDLDLYVYSLTKLIHLFFATGHINYARWLTKFQMDLANIDNTHPGLRNILESGILTVCRSDYVFNRLPFDLALEQTINRDCASRLTGIANATNNYTARLRWMVTRSLRSSFVGQMKEMAGLQNSSSDSAHSSSKTRRDNQDLDKLIKQIDGARNPFDLSVDNPSSAKELFNLTTGKAASEGVKQSLLSIPEDGAKRHKDFFDGCLENPNRFEQRLSAAKLRNYSSDSKKSYRSVDKKLVEVKGDRNLMGRLAILAVKEDIDF